MTALDKKFDAILEKSSSKGGGWTYVVMPGSVEHFGTRGSSRCEAWWTASRSRAPSWRSATAAIKLPIKADLQKAVGKGPSDRVTVVLQERLEQRAAHRSRGLRSSEQQVSSEQWPVVTAFRAAPRAADFQTADLLRPRDRLGPGGPIGEVGRPMSEDPAYDQHPEPSGGTMRIEA